MQRTLPIKVARMTWQIRYATSLLDNAPNYLGGCVIQKRRSNYLKWCQIRKLYSSSFILFIYFLLTDQVGVELDFSKALNRLGETAFTREDVGDFGSDDIGAAFQKFSVVTKELSNLMKNLVSRPSPTVMIFIPETHSATDACNHIDIR